MKTDESANKREMENRKRLIDGFLTDDGYHPGTDRGKARGEVEDVLRVFLDYADERGFRLAPMFKNGREVLAIHRGVDLTFGSGEDAVHVHVEPQRVVKPDLALVIDMVKALDEDKAVWIAAKYFDRGGGR